MKPLRLPPACVSKSEKNLWFLSQGSLPLTPSKLPGGHRGKGRRSWFSARSYHLCAVSGTVGLEESVAKAGNRDSFGPARRVAYVM